MILVRHLIIAVFAIVISSLAHAQVRQSAIPASRAEGWRVWPTSRPADCPFEDSKDIRGVAFTGRHAEYTGADTWYPSWASDGNMYSPWTDGNVNGLGCSSAGKDARTGQAKIIGDDPLRLQVVDQALYPSSPAPYGGRYPCGSLVYNGVWYYGTYCLMNENGSIAADIKTEHGVINWGVLGAFVGFRWSTDLGKTWTQTPHTPAKPLFPDPKKFGGPARIGSPHFVDFGKNLQHSPDGKAYLVAHGAAIPDPKPKIANASWITGDCVYLLRVTPSIENMNDAGQYEFFAGNDSAGKPTWTKDFEQIEPLVEWNNHLGCVTMTYIPPTKKFLMCITDGKLTTSVFDTMILESDSLTGPWRLASYMASFGQEAYFVNIPSKFIGEDGRTIWLCYAANFANRPEMPLKSDPPGSRYAMCLQEVRLLRGDEKIPTSELQNDANIARTARVSASSTHKDYSTKGAVDGVIGGFPGDISREWCTSAQAVGAWIQLDWDQEQTIDRIWLFDRPNNLDQITSGLLTFSDGSRIETGELEDNASSGLQIAFPAKKVKWVRFAVTGVKQGSPNLGLSEIAAFRADE